MGTDPPLRFPHHETTVGLEPRPVRQDHGSLRARVLAEPERCAYVARATGGDESLREEVEALRAYGDDDDSGILATSVSGVSLEDSPAATAGATLCTT